MRSVAEGTVAEVNPTVDPFARMGNPEPRPRYRSPEGCFEVILKSVMEDADLTDAEYRVAMHLATKPEGWKLSPKAIAADLRGGSKWSERKVEDALAGLHRKGYLVVTQEREHGRFGPVSRSLERSRVLYNESGFPQVSTAPANTAVRFSGAYSDNGSSSENGSLLLEEEARVPDIEHTASKITGQEMARLSTTPAGKKFRVSPAGVDLDWLEGMAAFKFTEPEPPPDPEPVVSTMAEFAELNAAMTQRGPLPDLTPEQLRQLTAKLEL